MIRLKELRAQKSQSQVARAVGIPQTTYSGYENENRQADYDTLIKLANYFNVSIDYLLGRSNTFTVQNIARGGEMFEETLTEKEVNTVMQLLKTRDENKSTIILYDNGTIIDSIDFPKSKISLAKKILMDIKNENL